MRVLRQIVSRDDSLGYAWQHLLAEASSQVYTPSSTQTLLPEQIYDSTNLASQHAGLVALMAAILEDAVECFWKQFVSTKRRDIRLAREAEEWFLSNSDASPFSFTNICMVLGMDPNYIRTGLKRWRQSPPAKWSARRRVRRHHPLRLAS